jgi:hypothetical protein
MPSKRALPKQAASFIETMDCLPVSRLPDGPEGTYEILCDPPHNISSVAFGDMWRYCFIAADKAQAFFAART